MPLGTIVSPMGFGRFASTRAREAFDVAQRRRLTPLHATTTTTNYNHQIFFQSSRTTVAVLYKGFAGTNKWLAEKPSKQSPALSDRRTVAGSLVAVKAPVPVRALNGAELSARTMSAVFRRGPCLIRHRSSTKRSRRLIKILGSATVI